MYEKAVEHLEESKEKIEDILTKLDLADQEGADIDKIFENLEEQQSNINLEIHRLEQLELYEGDE
jgi:uncharacterized protein YaaN involved in tellurite resistance